MNLLVRSLSGNPSSGSSGSGSPSSPTAPPRTGKRSSKSDRHQPLFSSNSSPGDLSPTTSQKRTTTWSDATCMVYDLEAVATPKWPRVRRTGGFEDYVPDSAPPSDRSFDYFDYFSNYGRGTPPHASKFEGQPEWHSSSAQEEFAPRPSYSSRFSSLAPRDDHNTLNNGFRRLWRRSSRETPTFRVTPPGVPSTSVQIPMNSTRHSLIIDNEDDTILASSLAPSSSLSQHRSYDHHPSSSSSSPFSANDHRATRGIQKRNSSFSSPATSSYHPSYSSPVFPRKLSSSNILPSHQPQHHHRPSSIMFHPSSAFQDEEHSRTSFYYGNTNDGVNNEVNDHQSIRHSQQRSGSLYDPRASSSRYEFDAQQIRRASAAASVIPRPALGGQRYEPWNPFRISFIETSAYTPQDIPDTSNSPDSEFLPLPSFQPSQATLHSKFQKQLHGEWVNETVTELRKWFKSPATQILVNVESKSKYPFIIFGPLGSSFDASGFVPSASMEPLSSELRINDGIYNVCGSVSRPVPSSSSGTNPSHQLQLDPDATPLGYVVTAFQTFPGEDSERLERNWITWTGAQVLYKYLPITVGLRNIIFYKRHDLHLLKSRKTMECPVPQQPSSEGEDSPEVRGMRSSSDGTPLISYVLLCECLTLSESILTSTCAVIDQLRARCCGYSALYINYSSGSLGGSSTDPQELEEEEEEDDDGADETCYHHQQQQQDTSQKYHPRYSLSPHIS